MGIPTAEQFLASVYRMRADAAEYLAGARFDGSARDVKSWESQLAKCEQLVVQAERRFGVPHRPLRPDNLE